MIRFLTAFSVALMLVCVVCLPSRACPPRYVAPYVAPYHAPVYTPVVAVYQPIPVAFPVFTVGYAPPALTASALVAPAPQPGVVPSGVPPGTPAPAQQPAAAQPAPNGAGIVVLNAKCASCHEGNVAQAKGKGFVLLAGSSLAELTEGQRLKCAREIIAGRMPKNGKLTDEEYGAALDLLTGETK